MRGQSPEQAAQAAAAAATAAGGTHLDAASAASAAASSGAAAQGSSASEAGAAAAAAAAAASEAGERAGPPRKRSRTGAGAAAAHEEEEDGQEEGAATGAAEAATVQRRRPFATAAARRCYTEAELAELPLETDDEGVWLRGEALPRLEWLRARYFESRRKQHRWGRGASIRWAYKSDPYERRCLDCAICARWQAVVAGEDSGMPQYRSPRRPLPHHSVTAIPVEMLPGIGQPASLPAR
jgi:ParB-like chromosome segregation protein Spo0J